MELLAIAVDRHRAALRAQVQIKAITTEATDAQGLRCSRRRVRPTG